MHTAVLRALRVATVALSLAVLSGPAVSASGGVLAVAVDEPFVVNGRTYEPAELTFRQGSSFTPSTTLDEIRVDGTSLGLLPVRSSRAEGQIPSTGAAVFTRLEDGRLVLLGYVVRGGGSAGRRRLVASSGSGVPAWDEQTPLVVLNAH